MEKYFYKINGLFWNVYERISGIFLKKYNISICMIFKNCSEYLEEWIEFHLLAGIEHFYLYNNNSSDGYREVLEKYIKKGMVTLEEWPTSPAYPDARNHFSKKYGTESKWVAFLDDDEFLFSPKYQTISDALKEYSKYPAVIAHWVMFGSNGHIKKPKGKVIDNYVISEGETHESYKIIVKPFLIKSWENPHSCILKSSEKPIDENFQHLVTFDKIPIPFTVNILRINHYASKSLEDGMSKLSRGWQCSKKVDGITYWRNRDEQFSKKEDVVIKNYIEYRKMVTLCESNKLLNI